MKRWQNWINAVVAFVTPLALIATVTTLILTTKALQDQMRVSFQGSMMYQALKDTREVETLYRDGKASESAVFATMQDVFVQYKLETIPRKMWVLFDTDFCTAMRDEHLQNAWLRENHSFYWDRFVAYLDSVAERAGNQCG